MKQDLPISIVLQRYFIISLIQSLNQVLVREQTLYSLQPNPASDLFRLRYRSISTVPVFIPPIIHYQLKPFVLCLLVGELRFIEERDCGPNRCGYHLLRTFEYTCSVIEVDLMRCIVF